MSKKYLNKKIGNTLKKFDEIIKLNILLFFNNKTQATILNGDAILAAKNLFSYLIKIYSDEKQSFNYRKIKKSYQKFGKEFEEAKIDFFIRIFAYINIIYVLEGIFKKTYIDFINLLKFYNWGNFNNKHNLKDRDKEIELIILWRNKVFGHTSYSYPKNDDIFTQLTSLISVGNSISFNKNGFNIGGLIIGDTKNFNFNIINIKSSFEKIIISHYMKWCKMFIDILKMLNKKINKNKSKFVNEFNNKIVRLKDIKINIL